MPTPLASRPTPSPAPTLRTVASPPSPISRVGRWSCSVSARTHFSSSAPPGPSLRTHPAPSPRAAARRRCSISTAPGRHRQACRRPARRSGLGQTHLRFQQSSERERSAANGTPPSTRRGARLVMGMGSPASRGRLPLGIARALPHRPASRPHTSQPRNPAAESYPTDRSFLCRYRFLDDEVHALPDGDREAEHHGRPSGLQGQGCVLHGQLRRVRPPSRSPARSAMLPATRRLLSSLSLSLSSLCARERET